VFSRLSVRESGPSALAFGFTLDIPRKQINSRRVRNDDK